MKGAEHSGVMRMLANVPQKPNIRKNIFEVF